MTKEIRLTKGYVALVDDDKYEYLNQWKWTAAEKNGGKRVYAVRQINHQQISMHSILLKCEDGLEVDHKDGNSLNNKIENLRPATRLQNLVNSFRGGATGFKGVNRVGSRYASRLFVKGINLYLGTFDTPEEAARAYDTKALEVYGEYAWLNFPEGK